MRKPPPWSVGRSDEADSDLLFGKGAAKHAALLGGKFEVHAHLLFRAGSFFVYD
jgi:hypothetical protein